MKQLRLNDTWLKGPQSPGEYSDLIVSSLKVRVGKSGKKTFSSVRRINGKLMRVRIGRYPDVRLVEARLRANEIEEIASLSPIIREREKQLSDATTATIGDFLNDYIADARARGLKSISRLASALTTGEYALLPFLINRAGGMPRASDVTIEDLRAWMAESYRRSPAYASHLRTYIVTAWKWAISNRYDYKGNARDYGITHNIAADLPTAPKGKPGTRFHSKDELKTLWHSLNDDLPTHRVLKLMISMGGLRVTEVSQSLARNWTNGNLVLPETKNGNTHTLPITQTAANVVEHCLLKKDPSSKYLFSHPLDPETPITIAAISRAAKRLNKTLYFEPWNPRDIRRTMKTHLCDAGVDERWLDIWHNHGQTASVARKHYIRSEYKQLKQDVAREIDEFLRPIEASNMPTLFDI